MKQSTEAKIRGWRGRMQRGQVNKRNGSKTRKKTMIMEGKVGNEEENDEYEGK